MSRGSLKPREIRHESIRGEWIRGLKQRSPKTKLTIAIVDGLAYDPLNFNTGSNTQGRVYLDAEGYLEGLGRDRFVPDFGEIHRIGAKHFVAPPSP